MLSKSFIAFMNVDQLISTIFRMKMLHARGHRLNHLVINLHYTKVSYTRNDKAFYEVENRPRESVTTVVSQDIKLSLVRIKKHR